MESGASNEPPAKQQLMERTSAVQVGVRVRPFTSKEISASRSSKSVLTCIRQGTQEIRLGERRFTYDAVFDESVSQEALYQSVGGPLMGNFLEGFNATVSVEETMTNKTGHLILSFSLSHKHFFVCRLWHMDRRDPERRIQWEARRMMIPRFPHSPESSHGS